MSEYSNVIRLVKNYNKYVNRFVFSNRVNASPPQFYRLLFCRSICVVCQTSEKNNFFVDEIYLKNRFDLDFYWTLDLLTSFNNNCGGAVYHNNLQSSIVSNIMEISIRVYIRVNLKTHSKIKCVCTCVCMHVCAMCEKWKSFQWTRKPAANEVITKKKNVGFPFEQNFDVYACII